MKSSLRKVHGEKGSSLLSSRKIISHQEARFVARQIKKLNEEKHVPFSEMLILYRIKKSFSTSYIDILKRELQKEQIDYFWLTENSESKRSFEKDDNRVKISTIDSSKGLDFQAVFIVNVDNMPFALEEDVEREVSLLYIGMTRAKEYLCLSYSGESEFTQYFDQCLLERKEQKKTSEKSG